MQIRDFHLVTIGWGKNFGCVTLTTATRHLPFCQLESESLQQTLTPDNLDHHGYERPSGSYIQVDIESEAF